LIISLLGANTTASKISGSIFVVYVNSLIEVLNSFLTIALTGIADGVTTATI
jgi:hypothetical protein